MSDWERPEDSGWERSSADLSDGWERVGKKALGVGEGILSTASDFISAIPYGLRAAGEVVGGADTKTALERAESSRNFLHYEPQTDEGKKSKESIDKLLERYQREVSDAFAHDTAELNRQNPTAAGYRAENLEQTAGDVISNLYVPGMTLGGSRGPRLSPEAEAHLKAMKDQPGPIPRGPEGTQLELPENGRAQNPYLRGELTQGSDGIPYREDLSRDVAAEDRQAGPNGELFPEQPAPGMGAMQLTDERPRVTQQEYTGPVIPDEINQALLDLGIDKDRIQKMKEKQPDVPTVDFPFRQEALERDPKMYDMRDAWEKALENGDKRGAERILQGAKDYLDSSYNISGGYGRLFESGKGTALPIEKVQGLGDRSPLGGVGKKEGGAIDVGPLLEKFRQERNKLSDDILRLRAMLEKGQITQSWYTSRFDELSKKLAEANRKYNHLGDIDYYQTIGKPPTKNIDQLKQSYEEVGLAPPSAEVIPFGNKQRGALGFKSDPEFEKFKSQLPEPLKAEAKEMFKAWKAEQSKTPVPEVHEGEHALTAVNGIPGVKDIFDEVAPIDKTFEEVRPQILNEEDLGGSKAAKAGRMLAAGGKLVGFGTQNTLVRLGVQYVDNALRRAEHFMRKEVMDKESGLKYVWEKLPMKDQAGTWKALIAAEGKETLSKERMMELGMNEKQVTAATKLREVLDKVFDRVNATRAEFGKKPLERRAGYIASRFTGDFIVEARDKNGVLIHRIGAATEYGAKAIRSKLMAAHPDLKFSEVNHEPLHRFGTKEDVQNGYRALLGMLDEEDPRVNAIESTMQEWLSGEGYDALGYKKHFLDKKEEATKGFEGGKEWVSDKENVKQGLKSVVSFVDQANRWIELQEANKMVKKIMADKELNDKQPNAVGFVKQYFDQAAGRATGFARTMDHLSDYVAGATGIGQSAQIRGIREVKQFFTGMYLGFWNIGFGVSQLMQPVQMLPPWFHYLVKQGGEAGTIGEAFAGSAHDSTWYFGGRSDKMSTLGKAAMEYSNDYGITDAHFLDDIKSLHESQAHRLYTAVSTFSMTYPEKVARTATYLSFTHFLNANGMKMGKRLYETAANLTDMSMVDYRLHERANIYKQMGIAGESMSALTTFKHNYYTQMWALTARGGAPVLANMVGMSFLFSGLMGWYGREDIDAIINLVNKVSPKRVPTLTEAILKAPDAVAFGGISAATGLDLSPKFSASNIFPDSLSKAVSPFGSSIADVAQQGYGLGLNPSKTQALRFANTLTPASGKSVIENQFTDDKGMFTNPNTLEGKVQRGPKEQNARMLALRSTKESREIQENYQKKNADQFYADRRDEITKQAKDAVFEGKMAKIKDLARKYEKYEGDSGKFIDDVVANMESRQQTEARRKLMDALSNPVKYKRLKDMTYE